METWNTRPIALIGVLSLALGLMVACAQTSQTSGPEEFYRGKTMTWIVASGTSGGGGEADTLARTITPYLAKETGTTIKVENMDGDGGMNFAYNDAKRDGLTLAIKNGDAVISNDILKAPGVLYEADKFNFLADVNPNIKTLQVSPKLPYRTLEALRQAKGLKAGGTTAKGSLATSAAMGFELLGLDGKVITGFKGKQDLVLALARGEVDFIVSSDSLADKQETDGLIVNVIAISKERSPILPKVPTMFELGVKVSKEIEGPYNYIAAGGFTAFLPPEVPKERVEYLRKIFQKLSDDKELQKAMGTAMGSSRPFVPGKDVQETMASIKANTALVSQLDSILEKYKMAQ
ncbi:MAG: hypothetical protein HYY30_02305 [Chloroflexi bacterium]|nr:hypothetical protein [Chloroflexota bacterium]